MPNSVPLLSHLRLAKASSPLATAEWALPEKLAPPLLRIDQIARSDLLHKLESARKRPLCVVIAPPGFGKTSLLTQWHQRLMSQQEANVIAWLSLEEEDNETSRFLAYIGLALDHAGLKLGTTLQELLSNSERLDPGVVLPLLIRAIRANPIPVTLMLDNYERAATPAIDAVITRLVKLAGEQLHVVIASRRITQLPLSRLAVQGYVTRIDTQALAFGEQETRMLLGEAISPDVAETLREHTEGWPVALQLAALWLSNEPARQAQVSRLSGRSSCFAEYLTEQVVADLDPPLRSFLLHTSILDRFDASLADHLRGAHDSTTLLAALGHFDGLLQQPETDDGHYRYHRLFAGYLQMQLERSEPAQIPVLHRRASHWHAQRGLLLEAVAHAIAAGEPQMAVDHLATIGNWQLLLHYGAPYVRTLLRQFDRKMILESPALNLAQAHLHMKFGEFGHAQLLLERFREFTPEQREPFARDYTVLVAILRGLLDEISPMHDGATRLAAQAESMDADDHLARGTLLSISACSALGRSQFEQAERYALQAEQLMVGADNAIGTHHALTHLGQSHFYRGQLDQAEAVYKHALAMSEDDPVKDHVLRSVSLCLMAQLHCERGRHVEAADILETAIEFIESHDGWFDIYAAAYETALVLARQRDRSQHAALALLTRVEQFARERRLDRLSNLATAWRLDVLLDNPDAPGIDLFIAKAGCEPALAHAMQHDHCWRHRAALGFALARWHRAAGRSQQSLSLLQELERSFERLQDTYHRVRAQARMALVLQQRGDVAAALPLLNTVLDHVGATQSWRVLLELGLPAKAMLRLARQHDPGLAAGSVRAMTLQAVLDKLQHEKPAASEAYSEREIDVLEQLASGCSNKQIARRLGVSENTVKFHLKNLYRKLDAGSREAALAIALQRGLVKATSTND